MNNLLGIDYIKLNMSKEYYTIQRILFKEYYNFQALKILKKYLI